MKQSAIVFSMLTLVPLISGDLLNDFVYNYTMVQQDKDLCRLQKKT
ncbi:hypothetical protein HBNCFIEN_02093 [Legionella sp. PC997]|nr:hypothetical protein HBNCFIEN_02093 [Legionella sp. PC997]